MMPTPRELEILDNYLDPPDESEDYYEYDRRFGELSDMLYEQMREDEILNL